MRQNDLSLTIFCHIFAELLGMTRTTKLFLCLPLFLLFASSCSSPSKRALNEFTLKDGTRIQCVEPPPDVVAKGLKINAEVAADHIGNLLKGTGGVDVDEREFGKKSLPMCLHLR